MKKLVAAAAIIAALSCQSCTFIRLNGVGSDSKVSRSLVSASNKEITEAFDLESFTSVILQVHGDVSVRQCEGMPFARVTFAENLMDYLRFDINDGVLTIKMDDSHRYRYDDMEIYLQTPDLNAVTIQGAGDLNVKDLVTDKFAVTIQGAGDVEVERIECGHIDALIQGAGDIEISGKAGSASLTIQGAGDIDAEELICDEITSSVQGAGTIRRK